MGFELVAKNLLQKTGASPGPTLQSKVTDKIKLVEALRRANFSVEETCMELRSLYDECTEDEKQIKRAILDTIAKMNGMMTPEETGVRAVPVINLQINGDNVRVNQMLCPVVVTE